MAILVGQHAYLALHHAYRYADFDRLSGLVQAVFGRTCLEGHLFVFINRRRDRIKLLWWDRDGLALWYKRLESGTFEMPCPCAGQSHVELDTTEIAMLLGGVSLSSVKRRKRYTATMGQAATTSPAALPSRQAG
jgi:transposase